MQKLFYGMLALLAVAFASCDNQKRLAQDLKGEWTSGVEQLPGIQAATSQIIDNLAFVVDSTGRGGMVVATGMIEVGVAPSFTGEVIETVSNGIAAESTVQGTWKLIDDDEMTIMFDFSTLEVNIEPAAVALKTDVMTDQDVAVTDSVSNERMMSLKAQILSAVREHYSTMRLIDDVKVKSNVLKFEIGDCDYVFHREVIN